LNLFRSSEKPPGFPEIRHYAGGKPMENGSDMRSKKSPFSAETIALSYDAAEPLTS